MTSPSQSAHPGLELLDVQPVLAVAEAEYQRLLGYPRDHQPGERARELAAWARHWYARHGRPWVYVREAGLQLAGEELRLDDREFRSRRLRDHLRRTGARRAMLVAVSAGRECEEQAGELWRQEKPDEYFFLEVFGSAVVEELVASASGRICDWAGRDDFLAVPHYSPGYSGWDIADQNQLFDLVASGAAQSFPQPLEVLTSGMLRPKKSLLAIIGLAPRAGEPGTSLRSNPCGHCSFSPCQYRRTSYRHGPAPAGPTPLTP